MRMVDGDILLLRMSGPLTAPVLGGFAADAIKEHGRRARGFILDYRPAVIVATVDDLGRMLTKVPDDSPLRRPGAFVCSRHQVETLRPHAQRLAANGLWRKTFAGTLLAHRWLMAVSAMEDRAGQ